MHFKQKQWKPFASIWPGRSLYSSPLLVKDGMGNLHQTPFVIFCYITPVQWTLSEVLVNQAYGQNKWWGNLLEHQHCRLLWNMWVSFQIKAIKWVLLLFDLPSSKVRGHIQVVHVEGRIPSPFDLDSWRGTQWEPQNMAVCMYKPHILSISQELSRVFTTTENTLGSVLLSREF